MDRDPRRDTGRGPAPRLRWALIGFAVVVLVIGCAGSWATLASLDGGTERSVDGWGRGSAWVLLGSLFVVAALFARRRAVAAVLWALVAIFAGLVMYQLPGTTLDENPGMFTSGLAWGAWLTGAGLLLLLAIVVRDWRG